MFSAGQYRSIEKCYKTFWFIVFQYYIPKFKFGCINFYEFFIQFRKVRKKKFWTKVLFKIHFF